MKVASIRLFWVRASGTPTLADRLAFQEALDLHYSQALERAWAAFDCGAKNQEETFDALDGEVKSTAFGTPPQRLFPKKDTTTWTPTGNGGHEASYWLYTDAGFGSHWEHTGPDGAVARFKTLYRYVETKPL